MTAQNPPATNSDLGREQVVPDFTRTIQDESHLGGALEVTDSTVLAGLLVLAWCSW